MDTEPFVPKWPDDPNDDGIYLPEDLDSRTPHPSTAPKQVFDIISSTYCPSRKPDNVLSKFEQFPKLPLELRRSIWCYSLPRRRMVEVLYDDETGECKSRCPVPTALHANSEARGVALEYYELTFATQKAEAMVYFDFGVDALFLGVGNFSPSRKDPADLLFRALKRQDIERLEHLVADDFINSFLLGIYADDDDDTDTDTSLSGGITDGDDSDSDTDEVQSSLTKFGLDGLQSLTIVDGLGNYDFVIQEIKNNEGEFHVWNILRGGKPVPLVNPDTVRYPGMLYFSEIWRSTELAKYIGWTKLTTLRYVGRKRLRQEEAWEKRISFMDQVVLPGTFNTCLYPKDGVIDRIVRMHLLDPEAFQNLREYFGGADPEYIYIAQNSCVCPIGHKHKEPCHWRLMDFNLRRALAKIDPAGDDPIEEAVPGAFPEESAVEEESSHPPQSPSEEVTAADSQIQEIDLEQPLPAFQDRSEHKSTSSHQQVSPPTLVKAPFLWRLLDQLEHYLPSGILGKFTVASVLISFGLLIYAILVFEVNQLWGPILGLGVCLSINHLCARTQPSSSPNLLALLFSLTWHSVSSVFGLFKNHISYNKTAPARQIASLQQGTSSANTLTAARQRFHKAFYVCMIFWIWLLLGLVSVALAFSLLKFLVELLSVIMLLIALLWLLGIWLMAHEMHNK